MTFAELASHSIPSLSSNQMSYIWSHATSFNFDDLVISWNALRPLLGSFSFFVRIRAHQWSNWFFLGKWGKNHLGMDDQQSSEFKTDTFVSLEIDTFSIEGQKASMFEVKIEIEGGADWQNLHYLWACSSSKKDFKNKLLPSHFQSVVLRGFPSYSQTNLPHPRAMSMCSPTSSFAAMKFLSGDNAISDSHNVVNFSSLVYDHHHKSYGNWSFNVAALYDRLQGRFFCIVKRLEDFGELHLSLLQGFPVIVSIKGPINGSATVDGYLEGHLIVVKGWSQENQEVICMDPAFPHSETEKRYPFEDFAKAWGRRRHLAYIFQPAI